MLSKAVWEGTPRRSHKKEEKARNEMSRSLGIEAKKAEIADSHYREEV